MQSWSLIILGFNEGKTLAKVVERSYEVIRQIGSPESEIVIVNDGSTDDTASIVSRLMTEIPLIKSVVHKRNLGIGGALLSGYAMAAGENVCAIPADGQFDVAHLLSTPMVGKNTMVSFYREHNNIYTPYRKLLTHGNRLVVKHIFNTTIRDINWIKVYKNENLKSLKLELNSSLVESEICIKLLRMGIVLIEQPAAYLPREYGTPKGDSLFTVMNALMELPKLFASIHRFNSARKIIK